MRRKMLVGIVMGLRLWGFTRSGSVDCALCLKFLKGSSEHVSRLGCSWECLRILFVSVWVFCRSVQNRVELPNELQFSEFPNCNNVTCCIVADNCYLQWSVHRGIFDIFLCKCLNLFCIGGSRSQLNIWKRIYRLISAVVVRGDSFSLI